MEISGASAPVQAAVSVSNGANHQLKTVVNEILSGLETTSNAIQEGIGQLLDVVA